MYNQMLDGNSAEELAHDSFVERDEDFSDWIEIRNQLLAGKEVENDFGLKFSMNTRLGEEYQEFADLIDKDFDIMAAYNRGELHPAVRELIFNEANTLASVICG